MICHSQKFQADYSSQLVYFNLIAFYSRRFCTSNNVINYFASILCFFSKCKFLEPWQNLNTLIFDCSNRMLILFYFVQSTIQSNTICFANIIISCLSIGQSYPYLRILTKCPVTSDHAKSLF